MTKQNQLHKRSGSSRGQPHNGQRRPVIVLSVLFGLITFAVFGVLADDAPEQTTPSQPLTQPTSAEPAAGEQINWQVISAGGNTRDSTTNYKLGGTVGQTASGTAVHPVAPSACCNTDGIRGDVDGSGSINVADAVYLVQYIFFGGPPPPCFEEGDVDASGSINVGDVVYLVDYIFFGGPAPAPCPGYRLNHGFWQSF